MFPDIHILKRRMNEGLVSAFVTHRKYYYCYCDLENVRIVGRLDSSLWHAVAMNGCITRCMERGIDNILKHITSNTLVSK